MKLDVKSVSAGYGGKLVLDGVDLTVPEGGILTLRAQENSLYTELVIEDNGPGIAPEDLPHLFERFYKGKCSFGSGIGIGLALSRMIIKQQNGSIRGENRAEGGARFTIRFYKGIV